MLELILQRGGKRFFCTPIGENPITIGRAPDNAVVLLDPDISRHHCSLVRDGGALLLRDRSTNGTSDNGALAGEARLRAGDAFVVGPWTIAIEEAGDEGGAKTIAAASAPTRVIACDEGARTLTTEAVEIAVGAPGAAPAWRRIAAAEITFGQHATCDVVVNDPFVSRRHCRIAVTGERLVLADLASTNGTFVGELRVEQTTLPPEGAFRIGESLVRYRLARRSEKIAAARRLRLGRLIGSSLAMRRIFAVIERVAPSEATVCIVGESGTGKELIARELHERSRRRRGPFIAINCGAFPPALIESQLFGHERGAFTGALERVAGLFEQARGGTLFLDEIGEMPLELQTRLLRVLEARTVRRVGGDAEIPIDVRILAATNRDLKAMVGERRFREDLFFRLYLVPIIVPPLRERPEDIPALAAHFCEALAAEGRSVQLTPAALDTLARQPWPGNARELRNAIERTLLFAEGEVIDALELKLEPAPAPAACSAHLRDRERAILVAAIEEHAGNLSRAARALGIARTTLQKKVRKHAIEVARPGMASPAPTRDA